MTKDEAIEKLRQWQLQVLDHYKRGGALSLDVSKAGLRQSKLMQPTSDERNDIDLEKQISSAMEAWDKDTCKPFSEYLADNLLGYSALSLPTYDPRTHVAVPITDIDDLWTIVQEIGYHADMDVVKGKRRGHWIEPKAHEAIDIIQKYSAKRVKTTLAAYENKGE